MPNTSLLFLKGTPFFTLPGALLTLGQINTFAALSALPATTYADAAATVPNTNPLQLDVYGRLQTSIYLSDAAAYPAGYKLTFEDSTSTVLTDLTVDQIPAATVSASGGTFAAELVSWHPLTAADSPVFLTPADAGNAYELDTTSGGITVVLPSAASTGNGKGFVFKKTSAANIGTINAASIDGATAQYLYAENREIKVSSNGAVYYIDRIYDPHPGGIATVRAFPFATVPSGWLECNGAAVPRTTYPNLFSALGIIHGQGDGSLTFNLPNYCGWFLRGRDHGQGGDPNAAARTAPATGGATGDNVGSVQSGSVESHFHLSWNTDAAETVDITATTYPLFSRVGGGDVRYQINGTATVPTLGKTSPNSGSLIAETRPRNVNVLYAIKVDG